MKRIEGQSIGFPSRVGRSAVSCPEPQTGRSTYRSTYRSTWVLLMLLSSILSVSFAAAIGAQETLEFVDELEFDDPQAWAMKYFASASILTSLGLEREPEPWAFELGAELIHIPHLDQKQRQVGFGGFKEEDLNRSPVWARLRVGVGLPADFRLVAGWAPPVEIDGIKASLWSLALERVLWGGRSAALFGRIYGQTGEAEGDLTCTAAGSELEPPGSPGNPFGCEEPSSDTMKMGYYGLELVATQQWSAGPEFHLGVAYNSLDMEFQVDALTFGFRDRTLLLADGKTLSTTLGATWGFKEGRVQLSTEVFYSALDVKRPGDASARNDPLLNLRGMLRYRF